ncbi:hypothetical protein FRC12_012026 [Ceratobasidium sp. 428]|nr:hypothetical protein FRC12_012026 [Ceratobasidium sp. 428]
MAAPTRAQLESLKRSALQQKCKELGIKANSKSEVLIDLILAHYQSQHSQPAGSSKLSTSTKRKAAPTAVDEDLVDDVQIASADNHVSARLRQSTRRRGAHDPALPPAKTRRVGTRTRVKVEPAESAALFSAPVLSSPRRVVEVVLESPRRLAKGKGKQKAVSSKRTRAQVDEEEGNTDVEDVQMPPQKKQMTAARPLEAYQTDATDVEPETTCALPLQSQADVDEVRITDLEMQLRNVRKGNDEVKRGIRILQSFQATVREAFREDDPDSLDLHDSMTLLAKLRDITPKLVAVSGVDVDAMVSRLESAEQMATSLETIARENESRISELKARIRELEDGKSAVGDLEMIVRRLQAQVNALPAALLRGPPVEESGTERVYTTIRAPSCDGTLFASGSQPRPLSRLSVPPEENARPPSQDQNQGRASSISRGPRSTRPPLAEKGGIRVGQPDVEVETSDPRRSIRRLVESSLPSTGDSVPPSRGQSTTPNQQEGSSRNPTPSQGKGKGKLVKNAARLLDTVEEVGDTSQEQALVIVAPTIVTSNLPAQEPDINGASASASTSTTSTSATTDETAPEQPPSPPPVLNSFLTIQPPRSPAHFFEVGHGDPSGSPPSSLTKSSSKAPTVQGSSPTRSLVPPKAKGNGPIVQLPFKLIASPTKSQDDLTRPAAPMGRVPKAPRSHQLYGRRNGGLRKATSDAPVTAANVFGFAWPGASSSTVSTTNGGSSGAAPTQLDNPAGFITPERLGNNFNLFPSARFDFGKTPGGLAFKATGRPAPGTPVATTTLFGTEVARDDRFADLPYDLDTSRNGLSWEEPILPPLPTPLSRNTTGGETSV